MAQARWPDKLHADKGYDFARCRACLRAKGIRARIARRGVESKERLGRQRWVVERTHARLAGFGKVGIRFEHQTQTHVALLSLACSVSAFARSCSIVSRSYWAMNSGVYGQPQLLGF